MNASLRRCGRLAGGVLTVVALTGAFGSVGCQTFQVGQTLPSAHHLRDDLLYAPKGPAFPLQNELVQQQQAELEYRASRP